MLDTSLRDSAAPQRIVVCEPRRMTMWWVRVVRVWETAVGNWEEGDKVDVEDGDEGRDGGGGWGGVVMRVRRSRRG